MLEYTTTAIVGNIETVVPVIKQEQLFIPWNIKILVIF